MSNFYYTGPASSSVSALCSENNTFGLQPRCWNHGAVALIWCGPNLQLAHEAHSSKLCCALHPL
eukprot:scaffold114066_cov18-Tisochrysis_lutea.AAC.1